MDPDPAPLWRRLAAVSYDGLLLLGLWLAAAMFDVFIRGALHLSGSPVIEQALLFLAGYAFFGWFWVHGGQTLGMRAWRLRLQRLDGSALRPMTALLRYAAGLLPVLCALYGVKLLGTVAVGIAMLGYLPCVLDTRGRAFNDLVAGTQIVVVTAQPASVQAPQTPSSKQHEQNTGKSG